MISSLKKLNQLFSRRDKAKLFGLLLLMLIASMLEIVGLGLIPAFVVAVSDPDVILYYPVVGEVLAQVNITTPERLLIFGALLLIIVFVIKNIYLSFYAYLERAFVKDRQIWLGTQLFTAYMLAPYTFHLSRNTAELLHNTNLEVRRLTESVLMSLLRFVMEGIMIVSIFIVLLLLEPWVTLATFGILGVAAGFFLKLIRGRIKLYGKVEQQERKGMIQAVNQGLGGIKDTRILNREPFFIDAFRRALRDAANALMFKGVAMQVTKPIIETLAVTSMLLIALLLLYQGRPITDVIPILALFGMATLRLMPAFNKIASAWTALRYTSYAVDPIFDDLAELKAIVHWERQEMKRIQRLNLQSQITVTDLTYHYPNSQEKALNGLNLTIPKGCAVAFVGPSGAGKSTLADVLLGLLEPQRGCVQVDGVDIKHNLRGWQQNIGYVPQLIYLSDDTVKANIAWGLPENEINPQALQVAVKAAQLGELIERLPAGLETMIGEQGVRLSGGQRQRVGIARALYHDPQVLIMDEATSALDGVTERFVIEAIDRFKGERTVIMIAHRLTTVQRCDRLYFMRDGRIEEQGTYTQLLEHSPTFRQMAA
jgi:ATP-binding cassette, subfamily B, bacterial PglK